jgi:hypothetical protein
MDNREFKFEEMKMIVGIGKDYFGFYFRSVILFFAVLGVLFKMFLDSAPGSDARLAIFIAGQLVCVAGVVGTLGAYPKYMLVAKRCKALAADLSIPEVYFPGTTRVAKEFLLGLIIVSALWALLYRMI